MSSLCNEWTRWIRNRSGTNTRGLLILIISINCYRHFWLTLKVNSYNYSWNKKFLGHPVTAHPDWLLIQIAQRPSLWTYELISIHTDSSDNIVTEYTEHLRHYCVPQFVDIHEIPRLNRKTMHTPQNTNYKYSGRFRLLTTVMPDSGRDSTPVAWWEWVVQNLASLLTTDVELAWNKQLFR